MKLTTLEGESPNEEHLLEENYPLEQRNEYSVAMKEGFEIVIPQLCRGLWAFWVLR